MKKFVIFALAVLVAFAMCSCQPVAEDLDGMVEFKVGVGERIAKALSATDPGQAEVVKVQLAFIPLEQDNAKCEYKIGTATTVEDAKTTLSSGEPSSWIEDELVTWTSPKATWNDDARLFLTQGKWSIYARALDNSDNVLYQGNITTFVNKRDGHSCTIVMTPKASDATGNLLFDGLTSTKVFDKIENEKLVYTIYDLTGATVKTGDILPKEASSDKKTITFNDLAIEDELTQGAYVASVSLKENTTATWVSAGGSAVNFGIYKDKETVITGDTIPTNDLQEVKVKAEVEEATFTLALSNGTITKVADEKYTSTFTATITTDDEDAETKYIMWFYMGELVQKDTIDGATTATYNATFALGHDYEVSAVVTGYINSNNKTKVDAWSNFASTTVSTEDLL